ncbi:MAG: hypothetical protein EA393_15810 [Bacteroidetes bacterium]|nr:MAG: hypothetical protein EA393_15810 [Bacteroidota bacterium]
MNKKFEQLRKHYPVFTFEDLGWDMKDKILTLRFHFHLDNQIHFYPEHAIDLKGFPNVEFEEEMMKNLVFHLGMAELVSYWKATCSPVVYIKSFRMNTIQANWWKKLYYHGLGEFFYLNQIETSLHEFMSFSYDKWARSFPMPFRLNLKDDFIIPVGGGKDSVVTLSILGATSPSTYALVVNQREATRQCIKAAGLQKRVLEVKRTIHPTLLELNEKGFLNGHTPFSSLLAFVSLMASAITGNRNIALSNESSANEATIPGTDINHQYSKSYEFEQDFRWYASKFICPDINYFSFLRPLNELQIAALFSKNQEYFNAFKSCNVGSKTDTWCCNCSKCLFTFIMLSPFLEKSVMKQIFSEDLLEKENLKPVLEQLAGAAKEKPFECVGTINEVNSALGHLCKNYPENELPALLQHFRKITAGISFTPIKKELEYWNVFHSLSADLEKILKDRLKMVQQQIL